MTTEQRTKYIDTQLIPLIVKHDKRFDIEQMAGTLFINTDFTFNGNRYTAIYATPYWEDCEGIPLMLVDDSGNCEDGGIIGFPLTGDLIGDCVNYVQLIDGWIRKHSNQNQETVKGFTSFSTIKVGGKFSVGKVIYKKVSYHTAVQVTNRKGAKKRKGFNQTDGVMVEV